MAATRPIYHLRSMAMLKILALSMMSCTKLQLLRPMAAFQLPSSTTSRTFSSSSSASAYGRTTFRHMRGDVTSWRMTSSPEDDSSAVTTSATAASSTPAELLEPYRNRNNLDDQVFSAMSADGGLKVTVATVRNLLNEMMIQHTMNPVPGGELLFIFMLKARLIIPSFVSSVCTSLLILPFHLGGVQ